MNMIFFHVRGPVNVAAGRIREVMAGNEMLGVAAASDRYCGLLGCFCLRRYNGAWSLEKRFNADPFDHCRRRDTTDRSIGWGAAPHCHRAADQHD
jgi:hypothetical protein